MTYEKVPNQTGQNWPVSTQYRIHPGVAVGFPSASYAAFPSGVSPITIFGAALIEWLNGDCGVDVGTGNWTGCANGNLFTPNGAPLYNPSLLNGHAGWSWARASAQRHSCATIDLAAPSFTLACVVRQDGWNSLARIMGCVAALATASILQGGVTPQVQMNNTSSVNTNGSLAIGAWGLIIAEFTNSVADVLTVGGTPQSGANAGAANPAAGVQIAAGVSGSHCNLSGTDFIWANGTMTAQQKTDLSAWAVAQYGAIDV